MTLTWYSNKHLKQDGTSVSKCSNLLVFIYSTLGNYQSNLNRKKNLDGSESSYQSTYL